MTNVANMHKTFDEQNFNELIVGFKSFIFKRQRLVGKFLRDRRSFVLYSITTANCILQKHEQKNPNVQFCHLVKSYDFELISNKMI